ncbi:MAG: SemiSWEET transporter [Pseudomonadota bacterium]
MNLDINHLGFAAAVCTTSAFVPQVWMVWRQRGAPGISNSMYAMFIFGVALWLIYGLRIGSWPVAIANAITLLLATSILAMKWYFERLSARS